MISGVGNIYQQSLKCVNQLNLKHINKKIKRDTCFPKNSNLLWKRTYYKKYKNLINFKLIEYYFKILQKVKI